jgi:hypothetical protein
MATPDQPEILCSNPVCRIAETGKCVEGLEPTKCPHFGRAPEPLPSKEQGSPEALGVRLPSAELLAIADAATVLHRSSTRVIATIGPTGAGKTSLIAGVYDLFQTGSVAGAEFAGSVTLHAFERVCHDARVASQLNEPHTERTGHGQVGFYHLALSGAVVGGALALLLGDRAGEEYHSAADEASISASFPEIVRADALTMLVDGARLLDIGARHNVRSEIEMMLQAFLDGDAIQQRPRLALVLTKLDEIESSPHHARALSDFTALFEGVRHHFGHAFETIESFPIAACPKSTVLPRGHGVSALLTFWSSPRAPISGQIRALARPSRAIARLGIEHK